MDQAGQLSADKVVLHATHDGSTAGQLAGSSAAVLNSSPVVSFGDTMLYKSWAEVPDQPPVSLQPRSVFLEVFSGKAWLTRAMRKQGWLALPPIDIVVDGDVLEPANILDPVIMQKVRNWCSSGILALVHFGTPCTTFSRARKHGDGGPPPIRSDKHLYGIPGISPDDAEKVRLGTRFLDISLELADLVFQHKGAWSIENPASSMLWLMPQVLLFIAQHPHVRNQLDMCQFGGDSKKPTVFLASGAFLAQISRQCPGETSDHVHVPLKGTVWIDGKEIFRTKLAQSLSS